MDDVPFIKEMSNPDAIKLCYSSMHELRPHIGDIEAFVQQIFRQQQQGYQLLAALIRNEVVGIIGYRLQENFLHGKFLFVDDLTVLLKFRGHGFGSLLLSASRERAIEAGCSYFVLATGIHKVKAQKLYFREGLLPYAIGFEEKLGSV